MIITPLTVAELVSILLQKDQRAIVWFECDNGNYSDGLTAEQIEIGEVVLSGPYDWFGAPEDAYGRPRVREKHHTDGEWMTTAECEWRTHGELLERRPCVIIKV